MTCSMVMMYSSKSSDSSIVVSLVLYTVGGGTVRVLSRVGHATLTSRCTDHVTPRPPQAETLLRWEPLSVCPLPGTHITRHPTVMLTLMDSVIGFCV